MAETLGCVGADLGLPDPRGAAFFLGLLGAEDAAAVAAGTWLVSSDMSLLNSGATREMRPKTAGCYCKEHNSRTRAADERNSRVATAATAAAAATARREGASPPSRLPRSMDSARLICAFCARVFRRGNGCAWRKRQITGALRTNTFTRTFRCPNQVSTTLHSLAEASKSWPERMDGHRRHGFSASSGLEHRSSPAPRVAK